MTVLCALTWPLILFAMKCSGMVRIERLKAGAYFRCMKSKLINSFIAGCLIGTASAVCGADTSLNARDKHFVHEFSNISREVERIGQLAQTQSQDAQVKELGQKLVQDYAQAGRQMATSAKVEGIGETPEIARNALREVNKLAGLSGAEFDQSAMSELFKCEESGAHQLDLETSASGNLALRQLAVLLQASLEPDLWQTAQLNAQFNGHLRL
jgi:predicted outer membrane protein